MTKQLRLLTLAAMLLLPLAACDNGSSTTDVAVTGSIAGTVTIDGAGAAGVVVTLSNGSTATTSATGTYTLASVPAGAYTVTISGAPTDVAFPSTTQAAVVATAGQVVTVNFAGARIRTSAIFGSVTSGALGLSGVTVTLTGPDTKTATTDANGQFSAAGLRAGTYAVAISGMPTTVTCATTTQNVTVAAGESKVASFSCTANSTAKISGILFIDENNKNDVYDGAALEDPLPAANILITLEGPTIGTTQTKNTDATGAFSFTGLAAGTYSVTIDNADPDIPAGYVYGGVSPKAPSVTLAAGAAATVNFPFDITTETIKAYAFLGNDTRTLPVGGPVKNVILDLYPTEADATALTNRIGKDTTDASGEVQFSFLRSADTSPGGTTPDQVVFAQISNDVNAVPAGLTVNGETRIEIKFNPKLKTDLAKDTFDLLNAVVTLKDDAFGTTGTALAGWNAELYVNDTTVAPIQTVATNAAGRASFASYNSTTSATLLPDTFYVKLAAAQAAAGTHVFTVTPTPERATVRGSFLRFVHNGLTLNSDTVDVGDDKVKFSDSDVFVRAFHEADDTVKRTGGDDVTATGNLLVGMSWRQTGAVTDSVRAEQAPNGTGDVTFPNVPTGQAPYRVWARKNLLATQFVLEEDTLFNVGAAGGPGDMSGGVTTANVCPLGPSPAATATCGTFGYKYEDGTIQGTVRAAGGTPAIGMKVRIRSNPRTIQPRPTDTTVTVGATSGPGAGDGYTVAGIREGQYIVSILHDSLTAAGDSVWSSLSNASTLNVDLQGSAATLAATNFTVVRMDTKIEGVVVNDRDNDANTVDPGEALAGSTIQLYRDGFTTITLDTLVATTTTNANGAYSFSKLREGTYAVKVTQQAGSVTVRKFSTLGAVVDTAIVHTTAAATVATDNLDNVNRVGNQAPNPLPRLNFTNMTIANSSPSHFTFLYSTGTVKGRVSTAVGDTSVVAMTITLSRCLVSPSQPSPPQGVALPGCTSYFPGFTPQNINTDSGGNFVFPNLQEGVYEVKTNPATAGRVSTTPTGAGVNVAGNPMLFTLSGNNDVETGNFQTP